MENRMRKTSIAVGATVLALSLSACDVTPGGRCNQEGSKATNSTGYTYTCKSTPEGRRIWQQDAPLRKDRP